ncbi:hypothetical protein LEP1GSC100_2461 [Leptospira interrogans serovar Bataviae str. UI 08561]|nr:hypothetical protein LEP1GSC100_2461 [Leptospira interrogans serovar Bataviae str. UI 08561]
MRLALRDCPKPYTVGTTTRIWHKRIWANPACRTGLSTLVNKLHAGNIIQQSYSIAIY